MERLREEEKGGAVKERRWQIVLHGLFFKILRKER